MCCLKPWNHRYIFLQRQVNSQPSAHFDTTSVIDLADHPCGSSLCFQAIKIRWEAFQEESHRILVKLEVGSCWIWFLQVFQLPEVCSKKAASRKAWNYLDAVTQGSRTPLAFPAAWLPLWMDPNKGAKQLAASCPVFWSFWQFLLH